MSEPSSVTERHCTRLNVVNVVLARAVIETHVKLSSTIKYIYMKLGYINGCCLLLMDHLQSGDVWMGGWKDGITEVSLD